jgi:hypothetical protein
MKLTTKIFLILIAIFAVFLYLQKRYLNRFNNDIEIFQLENPGKEQFERQIEQSYPSIFTNMTQNFHDLQKYSLSTISSIEVKERRKLNKNIQRHFSYYNAPLSGKNNSIRVMSETQGVTNTVTRQYNYRYMITQLKGVRRVYLFAPKNRKYLYAKGDKSQIDFFRDDLLKYPKLSETKYIEVVLYPGQMLYIPFNWWYNYEIKEDSFAVYHQSDTLFSKYLLKK